MEIQGPIMVSYTHSKPGTILVKWKSIQKKFQNTIIWDNKRKTKNQVPSIPIQREIFFLDNEEEEFE